MKNRILLGYKKYSDIDFFQLASRVVTKLENNPSFPHPPEALTALAAELPVFNTAIINAIDRNRIYVSIKNDKRASLEICMYELVTYVTKVCNGDRTLLLSSGFEISGTKKPNNLKPIERLEVKIDQPNEAVTKVKRVRGARAYIHQYTPEPLTNTSIWTTKVISLNTHTFTGLQSKERFLFQVIAIGNKGQEVSSPVVARVIQ